MKYLPLFIFLFLKSLIFGAHIALVQKTPHEYSLIGDTSGFTHEIPLKIKRLDRIISGENFIVSTGKMETWIFGTNGSKLTYKKVSTGFTDWIKIDKKFLALRFREGIFLYTLNDGGEFIGALISPAPGIEPGRLIFMDSLVLHEWGSRGTFISFMNQNQLKSREIHNRRVTEIYHYVEASGTSKPQMENSSKKWLGTENLGSVSYPEIIESPGSRMVRPPH